MDFPPDPALHGRPLFFSLFSGCYIDFPGSLYHGKDFPSNSTFPGRFPPLIKNKRKRVYNRRLPKKAEHSESRTLPRGNVQLLDQQLCSCNPSLTLRRIRWAYTFFFEPFGTINKWKTRWRLQPWEKQRDGFAVLSQGLHL